MSSFKLKVLVIGDPAVGKTSLVQRFIKERFSWNYKLTVGMDILTKDVEFRQGEIATLSIWDIGGQQKFEYIRSTLYKGLAGALIIFDLARAQTFKECQKWLDELKTFAGENIPFLLIGNKMDFKEEVGCVIDEREVLQFAERNNTRYIETSAKDNINVVESFEELTRLIITKRKQAIPTPPTKPKRVQNLETLFKKFLEHPDRIYNELLDNLNDFNEIKDIEEYNAINLLLNKVGSLKIDTILTIPVILSLLKMLYNYSIKLEDLLINKGEISEKIALECYKILESFDPQDYNRININIIKELYHNFESNEKSVVEYLKELFCHFLFNANLIFIQTNYHKIKQFFYEDMDEELPYIVEFKALYELANIKLDYYELLKNLIYIFKTHDVEDLDIVLTKYLMLKHSIPKDLQIQIDQTINYIQKSLQKIKIFRCEIKDEPIVVNETYNILELGIKNNTLDETLGFNLQIEPVGFENFSHRDFFKRYFRLRPKEDKTIFLDLGRAKKAGQCPIHFTFSYKNNVVFHNPIIYKKVNEELKRTFPIPKNIQIIKVESSSKKLSGFNTIVFDLKIENKEKAGYVLKIKHNGYRYFGRISPDVSFWIETKSTEKITIMIDLSTEKIIKPMKYPIMFYLVDATTNIVIDQYEFEVEIKSKRGMIIWKIVKEIAPILK